MVAIEKRFIGFVFIMFGLIVILSTIYWELIDWRVVATILGIASVSGGFILVVAHGGRKDKS